VSLLVSALGALVLASGGSSFVRGFERRAEVSQPIMRDRFADLASMPEVADGTDPALVDAEEDDQEPEQDEGAFMQTFFDDVKKVRDDIQQIEQLVGVVEHRHDDLLVAVSQDQTARANEELDKNMDQISKIANRVRAKLKKLDPKNDKSLKGEMNADARIRKSQHSTLPRKFMSVMSTYNDIQSANKRKYREAIKRQCKIVDPDIKDETVDDLLESGMTTEIFKGKRLDEANQALSDIKDRHEDILRLERSLKELHDMFVDMALLVEEQGAMVDHIENSVDKAAAYVERGRRNVHQAAVYQERARHKKICCYIVIGLVIAVVVTSVLGFTVSDATG